MNVTDLITDRMHENLKPRDINEFEKYRWLVEMIAIEYAQEQVNKTNDIHSVSQRYTIEDIERCVENWGLCKVEKEYIEKFLNEG